ncbi:MAG: hypothetical protein FWD71_12540 [Oscillospiraceae bacterium]|nr:hypothetical protein [Oscillospiraceae bacterium]
MDNNLSDLVGGLLSNPEMLNKIMTLLPVVTQMMNSDNSNSKAIETTVISPPNTSNTPETIGVTGTAGVNQNINQVQSAENLMSNENVMTALKNLVIALSSASVPSPVMSPPDAVMTSAVPDTNSNNGSTNSMGNIANILSAFANSSKQSNTTNSANNTSSDSNNQNTQSNQIEKTLGTLKNISGVTNPESDHRAKLLLALKPFLKETRQSKIDTAIKYISAAKIFNMFGKNGFV